MVRRIPPIPPGGGFRAPGRGGRGRMGGFGLGPGGFCICSNPNCHYREPHVRGVPCYTRVCPQCGSRLTRGR